MGLDDQHFKVEWYKQIQLHKSFSKCLRAATNVSECERDNEGGIGKRGEESEREIAFSCGEGTVQEICNQQYFILITPHSYRAGIINQQTRIDNKSLAMILGEKESSPLPPEKICLMTLQKQAGTECKFIKFFVLDNIKS